MERLSIDELIAHCDRQLERLPSGTSMYQEHESVRAYLQILRHYQGLGPVEKFRALKDAEEKRREGCEWCIGFCPDVTGDPHSDYRICPYCGRDLRGDNHGT